ncbi:hypothetical protein L3Q82_010577, partial [Scortum barcoo]
MGLHYILQHLDSPGTYARILFVDFSLVFNTIIPDILHSKLSQPTVPVPTCQWISNFLTEQEAAGEVGEHHIQHLDNQHWSPPGTTQLSSSLIRDGDESAYRREVEQLATTDSQDYRKNHLCQPALHSGLVRVQSSGNRQSNITADPSHPGHNLFPPPPLRQALQSS